MTDVGAGVVAACEAFTRRIDGVEIGLHGSAFDGEGTLRSEGCSIASHAGRQDAVEHVHPAGDQLDELSRRPEPHSIASLVFRKVGLGDFYRLHHFGLRFAHAHTTDGVAVEVHLHECLGAFLAQVGVVGSLDDSEDQLALSPRLSLALGGPTERALHSTVHLVAVGGVRRAFVKHHRDVRTQRALDLHALLRPEENRRPIQVAPKLDSVIPDLANLAEREDLETA